MNKRKGDKRRLARSKANRRRYEDEISGRRLRAAEKASQEEAKRPPEQALTIDAIGLRALERDEDGRIKIADSAEFGAHTNGNLLILESEGQKPIVIGWGFVDALLGAVALRRKRARWWRRLWRRIRGQS